MICLLCRLINKPRHQAITYIDMSTRIVAYIYNQIRNVFVAHQAVGNGIHLHFVQGEVANCKQGYPVSLHCKTILRLLVSVSSLIVSGFSSRRFYTFYLVCRYPLITYYRTIGQLNNRKMSCKIVACQSVPTSNHPLVDS